MEEWRDIKGYEGIYQVSSYGRIRSLRFNKEKIIKTKFNKYGYEDAILRENGVKKCFKVHRLVAEAFISNPNNLPEVNHKDEDKSNNNIENLEWCSRKYNMNYGTIKQKLSNKNKGNGNPRARKIICVTTGEIFDCITFAEEKYNIRRQNITHCLKGRQSTAGKHPITGEKLVWRYYES